MHSPTTMPNEEAMMNRSYFNNKTAITDADILKDRVITTKDKRCARVSMEFGIQYGLSTKAMEVKFVVSSYLIPTLCDGETGS